MYQNDTLPDMSNVTPFRRPINWDALRPDEAETIIRRRCTDENTASVIFTDHAWDRVSIRDITREDVFKILRTGFCHDQPVRTERGDWKVIMTKRIAGRREAGVVTIILANEEKLVIPTVEWMDLR